MENKIDQLIEEKAEKEQGKEQSKEQENVKDNETEKGVINKEVINKEVINKEVLNKEVLNKEVINKEVLNKEVINKEVSEIANVKENEIANTKRNIYCKDNAEIAKNSKVNINLKGGNTPRCRAKVSNSSRNFKGYNKIRSTGKTVSSVSKFNDSYAIIFPNALPVKQILWGLEPLNKIWRYCSIVYARPNKNKNSSNCSFPLLSASKGEISNKGSTDKLNNALSNTSNSVNNINKGEVLTESDYDYYVHWEKLDRRLDCWIPYEHLRPLEKEPDDGLPCVKDSDNVSDHEHAGIDKEYLREHEENTKLKTINKIKIGKYIVDTWYFSPYPKEYQNIDILYICEFCLSFFKEESELIRHTIRCEIRHPPGNEIYRTDKISIFEMDGNFFRIYCENLCFLSKLFLDHKTLKHRVSLFLFYVITEYDELGYHITGYFSKEKYSKNNVSCILTLPQHQKKGYGRFLINFSYFLSQKEKRTGTPERPLSDLGLASYMTYWHETLLKVLLNYERISISELSEITSIETNDILTCLEEKGVLKYSANNEMFFYINTKKLSDVINKITNTMNNNLDKNQLHWVSYDYYLALHE